MTIKTTDEPRRHAVEQAIGGVGLALAGAAGMAALFYITNSRDPLAQRAGFQLGLAGVALLSAVAQAMLFAGAWLMGRAAHRRSSDA